MQGGQNNRPIHVAVLNNTYIVNASTVAHAARRLQHLRRHHPAQGRVRCAHAGIQSGVCRCDSGAAVSGPLAHGLRRHDLHGEGQDALLLARLQRHADEADGRAQRQVRRRLSPARREIAHLRQLRRQFHLQRPVHRIERQLARGHLAQRDCGPAAGVSVERLLPAEQ